MTKLSVEIGRRIRTYRIDQKLSQEELAEKCGLHPTYIGQVERGEKNATIESISKISAGLSVPLDVFFEKIDDYDGNCSNNCNYPSIAYEMVQSVPKITQEKLIEVLKLIINTK